MGTRLLRILARLVPAGKRREWLLEWTAERFHNPGLGTSLAAVEDALRLRVRRRRSSSRHAARGIVDDLTFAARGLWRTRGFTLAAVLTLALAIGANAAVLSVADAVLFRPLPYSEPERVFALLMENRRTGSRQAAIPPQQLEAIDRIRGVRPLARQSFFGPVLRVPGDYGADTVSVALVTANYFDVLGVTAASGRTFVAEDTAAPGRVAVLTYAAWQQRFGGDEQVVGRAQTLGDATFDIVGVLPAGFIFPAPSGFSRGTELVTVMDPAAPAQGDRFYRIARLEPGVSREQAQAEIETVVASLAFEPDDPWTPVLAELRPILYPTGRPIMTWLLVAAVLVLLIGTANLANLLLGRTWRRQHETGVRAALGASRAHLVRPLLFEAAMLGLCGAALAVLFTWLGFDALARQVPAATYGAAPVGVDIRVASITLLLGLLAGALFGAVPAWRAARTDADALIRGTTAPGGTSRGHLGRPMIVAQVALSVVVVFGAVVTGRALIAVLQVPLGFVPDNVITIGVSLPREVDEATADAQMWKFFTETVKTLAQRGDVVSAGAVGQLPLGGATADAGIRLPGSDERLGGAVYALPGYWQTAGIPLLRGRLPSWDDVDGGSAAAVLSESAAHRWFGQRDPLGAALEESHTGRHLTIVGIVEDVVTRRRLWSEPVAYVLPYEGNGWVSNLLVRVRSPDDRVLSAIRHAVVALAPELTVVNAAWWSDWIGDLTAYRNPRFQALVLGGFGALALALTGLGIFAVVAFLVVIRTREMGVRAALGATPGSLMAAMMRHAMLPVGAGLLIGLIATRWIARLAEAQLFDVETRDPLALAAVSLGILAIALLAAWLPARRASRVDPVVALRTE